jgi:hypothetical protein
MRRQMRLVAALAMTLMPVCVSASGMARSQRDWRDYIGAAHSAAIEAGPVAPGLSSLGECIAGVTVPVATPGGASARVLTVAYGGDCRDQGAVSIMVWEVQSDTTFQRLAGFDLDAQQVAVFNEDRGFSGRYDPAIIEARLTGLVTEGFVTTGNLPAWPDGALVPNLPPGLTWAGGVERPLYEALRLRPRAMICLQYGAYRSQCLAHVPERGSTMIDVLTAEDSNFAYGQDTVGSVASVLVGRSPPPSERQIAAAIERRQTLLREVRDSALRNVGASASPPAP